MSTVHETTRDVQPILEPPELVDDFTFDDPPAWADVPVEELNLDAFDDDGRPRAPERPAPKPRPRPVPGPHPAGPLSNADSYTPPYASAAELFEQLEGQSKPLPQVLEELKEHHAELLEAYYEVSRAYALQAMRLADAEAALDGNNPLYR